MNLNFFNTECSSSTQEVTFGIRDGIKTDKAYLDFKDKNDWHCTIYNEASAQITFYALDNCITLLKENGEKDRCCDCMLTYENTIVFIELKNKDASWKEDGIDQLEITINHFIKTHNIDSFRYKKAFLTNRKHPNFHVIENETMKKFFDRYKVRLNVQAEIKVK